MNQKLIEILIQAKDDASATLARVGGAIQGVDDKQKDMLNNAAKGVGIVTGLGAIALAGVGAYGLYAGAGMEQASISMKNLLGNAQLANSVFGQLAVYANNTPFEFADIQKTANTLLGFGYGGQQTVNVTKQLGDVAAASGGHIQDLALVTGQIFSQGKLRAQDLYQVINDGGAGVVKIMAQNAGGMQKLTDEFNKGGIPAQQYFDAINQATGKGGFAFQGAQNQANTFNGRISTLKDAFTQLAERMVGVNVTGSGLQIDPNGLFAKASNAVLALIKDLNGLPAWWDKNKTVIELAVAAIVGALLGLVVVLAIVNAEAIIAAISMALFAAPFILIGAAIGALAFLVVTHWTTIKNFIGNAIGAIVNVIGGGLNWLKNNWASALGFVIGFVATLPVKLPILMYDAIAGMIKIVASINWYNVFYSIGLAALNIVNGIKNAFMGAWHFLTSINWGAVLTGIGKGVGNAIIDLLQGAINGAFAGIPGAPKVHLPHFASGVQNFGGGLAVVGEQGPELVSLPAGSSVFSNPQSQQLAGGGGAVHIHLHTENFLGTPGELRNFAEKIWQQLQYIDRANGTPSLPAIGVRPLT